MGFSTYGLLVLLHVLAAAAWFGGNVFVSLRLAPAVAQAGPAAFGFSRVLARRGGIGSFFAISGALAILFGAALYGQNASIRSAPFAGGNLWITLGATFAVLAYLHGLTANLPVERRWQRLHASITGAPTQQQENELASLDAKFSRHGYVSTGLVAAAMVCMLLYRVVS